MEMSDEDRRVLHEGSKEEQRKILAKYNQLYTIPPGQDSTPHRRWQRRVIAAVRRLLRLPNRPQDYTTLRAPDEPRQTLETRNPDGSGDITRLLPGREWQDGKRYARGQSLHVLWSGEEEAMPEEIRQLARPGAPEDRDPRKQS